MNKVVHRTIMWSSFLITSNIPMETATGKYKVGFIRCMNKQFIET